MRLRLFSLLLVPTLTIVVLAWLTIDSRNSQVEKATAAAANAELFRVVSDLDHALGVEATRSAELYQNKNEWRATRQDIYRDTWVSLSALETAFAKNPESNTMGGDAMGGGVIRTPTIAQVRGDVIAGRMSPLQIIDRYSYERRQLLDGLQSASLAEGIDDPDLIAILALIEARDAHLNERIAVDLAITYGQWAPGQHSAAVAAQVAHDTQLRSASNYVPLSALSISPELAIIREVVTVTSDTPSISNADWREVSDEWLEMLNQQIDLSIDQTTNRLEVSRREATRNRTLITVVVAAILAVVGIFTAWVAYRLTWRVKAIADQAAMLSRGVRSTSALDTVGGNDEITGLARAFDDMAGELSKQADAQQIESLALEAIAEGHPIESTLDTIVGLLGKDRSGRPLYRFSRNKPGSDTSLVTGSVVQPIESSSDRQQGLWIEKVHSDAGNPDITSDQMRTAIGLATMAQRRTDDAALLENQATFDPLTGLYNRREILVIAERVISQATGESAPGLVYIDLDNFKRLNDSHGHLVGDMILRETAHTLTELADETAGWAGRIGGDEFIVILPATKSDEEIQGFADSVVAAMSGSSAKTAEHVTTEVSVGAVRARTGTVLKQLLSEADQALYAAKEAGRNQAIVSNAALRERIEQETILKNEVLVALERNEFTVWYQPIWNNGGTTVCAIEALARWNYPAGGVRGPGSFMPVLEQQHLLAHLDRWIFDKVCADVASWTSNNGRTVPVHVNVSSMRLEERGFVEQTIASMAKAKVRPDQIVIEVVESGLIHDIDKNGARLQQLRDLGIDVATDDFGQGYSSLAYLRDLSVDILKLDRQFVDQIDNLSICQSIVSSVIGLAHALNLQVVAEGVERQEELDWLVDAGCECFQGFLLGRPVPEPEIRALLGSQRDPREDRPNPIESTGTAVERPEPSNGVKGLGL